MSEQFTMTEYIERHNLGVDPHLTPATKMIAEHLQRLGYRRVRIRRDGKKIVVWTNHTTEVKLSELQKKLDLLESNGVKPDKDT
jgi:hypothetical protein